MLVGLAFLALVSEPTLVMVLVVGLQVGEICTLLTPSTCPVLVSLMSSLPVPTVKELRGNCGVVSMTAQCAAVSTTLGATSAPVQ